MTDAELVRLLRLRDTDALMSLMDAYAGPVHSLVHRILAGTGTDQDVEECVSDVFHKTWLRIDDYDANRASLRTWLLILAKYEALQRRRRLQRITDECADIPFVCDPGPLPEQVLATQEERHEVQQALQQLPPLDRELVYRRYFLGEKVDDLTIELGLTRQAADNRLWRARKALRQILTVQGKEVPVHEG